MVAALVDSPQGVGWLVDPSLELQEAGVECTWKAPSPHDRMRMQWRADNNTVSAENRQDATKDRTTVYDTRENECFVVPNKKSIFRRKKHKIRLKKASSTDAVTDEAPSHVNTSIVPSMIHIQRASSRDSVECVLANVFMLPTSSSTVTDDDEFSNDNDSYTSATSHETVVIDAQALEMDFNNGIPCNIQVPTAKETIECVLMRERSATSSTIRTLDSSDEISRRLVDLLVEHNDGTEEMQQYRDDESMSTLGGDFVCSPQCIDYCGCQHYSGAATNTDAIARFFTQAGRPSAFTTLQENSNDRYDESRSDCQSYKYLDAAPCRSPGWDQLSAVPSEEFANLILQHENYDGEPSMYSI